MGIGVKTQAAELAILGRPVVLDVWMGSQDLEHGIPGFCPMIPILRGGTDT